METIYIAGGCFWGVQKYYQLVKNIESTECGYVNGNYDNPRYEELKSGQATHAEAVKLTYDNRKISLNKILDYFFSFVDPVSVNKQGCDEGLQYRTGVYYVNPRDEKIIRDYIAEQQKNFSKKITIEVEPLKNYQSAEEYHQNYFNKYPEYICQCHIDFDKVKDEK